MPKEKINELYSRYKDQIDTIASLPGMKYRKVSRIVAWFYGGSEESWRKLLAKKKLKQKIPTEVKEFLQDFVKRKTKA